MIDRRISELILELYRGTREHEPDSFRAWALNRLGNLIPFDSAMWGSSSDYPRRMHEVYLYNQPRAMLENYSRFEDQDILRTAVCRNPASTVNLADLVSPREWAQTDIYRNHADRFGIRAILCSIDIQPVTGIINVISLWRSDLGRQFDETERVTKEFVAPHLFEACRYNRLLCMHPRHTGGSTSEAPAIMQRDGLLLEADDAFVELLRLEWPNWQGAMLPATLVDELINQQLEAHVGRRTVVRAKRAGGLILLRVWCKASSDPLTPRELTIAELYVTGLSHKKVAARLSLSPTTVKSHLRHIYSKLNINNKTELMRILGHD
ncbi:MAG: LuxR family transcriptional regulator [Proteobacteria bacterium]|nr:MAG: LuxR family transcriptional regulator [Pseudomonadota bacterium]